MSDNIIHRGRGPEIKGTRITVYDILDYYKLGWHHTAIAMWFGLSSRQVLSAIAYIESNRDQVQAEYEHILERSRKGNRPEIQARLDAIHAKYAERWAERRRLFPMPDADYEEENHEGTLGGH